MHYPIENTYYLLTCSVSHYNRWKVNSLYDDAYYSTHKLSVDKIICPDHSNKDTAVCFFSLSFSVCVYVYVSARVSICVCMWVCVCVCMCVFFPSRSLSLSIDRSLLYLPLLPSLSDTHILLTVNCQLLMATTTTSRPGNMTSVMAYRCASIPYEWTPIQKLSREARSFILLLAKRQQTLLGNSAVNSTHVSVTGTCSGGLSRGLLLVL